MTTITPTIATPGAGAQVVKWAAVSEDDTCAPAAIDGKDRCVQFTGTWGGATLQLHGANEEAGTYLALRDLDSNDIEATSDATGRPTQVRDATRWVKPVATVAGTGRSVTITISA